ncbi:MAG: 50S ribosomal protein L25 [Candidatus Uhrbacteria bacterium GW2011_GWE2_45_35]|uniref:Large ribosomal subunit protein bL25 n=2 Tax=Candidatus Uhriibacteriota TaxID=1752732 RepID=A0A0G1LMD8_9BACT|nr:MAG: 50S ribosomal protein L25 [Candidatus Uhrbacteria bacterium GW2011_GWF2_44_350]KKU08917.1 MAG: 50S ribosomal protein L25 [Candidatus Uhrbacteria bacterium GW2011_GWE2_45_35]HBR80951.1 50S ribosomal protein L25 [Candidatus Uhrbacteria bacterium]HCU31899.1 50S ribosomal protein L25 [Candidatus Uhrbacteria bacterium]
MTINITAKKREAIGRANWKNRVDGNIPAVVYGAEAESQNICVNRKALVVAFREAGESSLVDLAIDGQEPLKVLIQDLQKDPLTGDVIHADFRVVDLTKEITAEIKLEFVGESPAVKGLGGTLIEALDTLEVRALPTALVSSIEVDISSLKTFDDAIHVSDLVLPAGIVAINSPEDTIAVVEEPRSEEEMAELNKTVEIDVAAVEVEKKEKTDEAAGSEEKKPV